MPILKVFDPTLDIDIIDINIILESDIEIQHISGYTNMVLDALSWSSDLVMIL